MKIPLASTGFSSLISQESDNLGIILDVANSPTPTGKYLHGENLRQREPPTGLTSEQCCLGVKFARMGLSRVLPMTDKYNRSFNFTTPPLIIELLHEIDSRGSDLLQLVEQGLLVKRMLGGAMHFDPGPVLFELLEQS